MSIQRDIQLIFELGTLRNIDRVWKQMLGPNTANLAEHHMRVAWISLILAKHEKGEIDEAKLLKMALVHDLPESRTGDVHYISRLYTTRNESLAITDILKDTALDSELVDLWHEYEKHDCIESKIVKDADTLDVSFELREFTYRGEKMEESLGPMRNEGVYDKLFTKSAKEFWNGVKDANPNDWHVLAKNRHTAGDWKQS